MRILMSRVLTPLPQHRALVDWLKLHEKEVWAWFADAERQAQNTEEVRLSLLRDTYRLDPADHPEVFEQIAAAKALLGLEPLVVHAYQAQGGAGANAAICYLPDEAHLIFSGPILSLLSLPELRAVIGHELAHYLLWQMDDGDFYLADRILHQSADHAHAQSSHGQSARLWSLVTELFADRGSLQAADCLETAVASLVKTTTGLAQVSAKSYLAQAAEIFSKSKPKSEQVSHPETFLRARALQLWAEESPDLDAVVDQMLEEDEGVEDLSLLQQVGLTDLTLRFLRNFLRPAWFHSEAVLAHARLFFPDFAPAAQADDALAADLETLSKPRREFLCYVMLDFCAADPDLEDLPLAAAVEVARDLGCLGHFEKILVKELQVKVRDMKNLKTNAAKILAAAAPTPS
jgi:hypothetical protein